ncbi:SDR family NAD(P)-dependent oxidoreductase [Sandaracinobacteroides saxicola]|uniref:SDR family oxidoreductase n=1 Tax=Sandaracinobacteroides saxicola TaxID=2759707 RepID=A0A7G5IEH3_9SPHN|nr:SDR family oxidoreductase [Sandaracinobacteroides saxicola]QMW21765.1 SDR family oxidoreductase [Sandaracinobacteroides saxicola]
MELGLAGKRAVITGATKGLGLRIARLLLAEGCDLAFCARTAAGVEEATADFAASGRRVRGWVCDVRDADAYRGFLEEAVDWLGGVDAFIPNVSAKGGLTGEAQWQANFEVDLLGAVRGMEIIGPQLVASRGAALFMVTTAAIEHFPVVQPYNVMKATLIVYAKQLSQTLGAKGVRVNCISPGSILYPGSNWEKARDANPAFFEGIRTSIPEGRLGTAEEVANVAVFLLSPAASWINGENVIIDGGQTKRVHY